MNDFNQCTLDLFKNKEEFIMQESFMPISGYSGDQVAYNTESFITMGVAPFFSMRKVRLIYNELAGTTDFEFKNFDAFKHRVLNSVAPQLELNKWQAIAARR